MAWAEPDVDEAAAALKMLRSAPQRRELLGQRASAAARDMFSPARYLASVTNILRL
jgi:glycosyltransferase involved in cell wall biosynthesis